MLAIRLKTSEIPVLRDELEERHAVAIEAVAEAQWQRPYATRRS
jgi:hypothetical protein